MKKTTFILSKSSFMRGIQCPKSLYLHKHHPELRDDRSDTRQMSDRGADVGRLARGLFPGGVDAGPETALNYGKSFALTRKNLSGKKTSVIYEAAFLYDEVMAATDILVRSENGWKAYEVKSSSSITDAQVMDASLQYYVMKNAGLALDDIYIVYINNEYIRKGELELERLFRTESVLERVKENQGFIEKNIKRLKQIIRSEEVPEEDIGPHCSAPRECDFTGHCWQHIPENSVFDISYLTGNVKFELYREGIIRMEDVPYDILNEKQVMQVEGHRKNRKYINRDEITTFVRSLAYPLYFVDFETFRSPVPFFDNIKPYQQIPFQYSLHYLKKPGGRLKHSEFLGEPGKDPRRDFIKKLLDDTSGEGDILVYNETFEKGRLQELGREFPEFSAEIEDRLPRIKDLMAPFQKKHIYLPAMRGKHSIKRVLPALVPNLSYEDLEISNGGLAMYAYEELLYETDKKKACEVMKNLLEYCKMDTLAMVKILQKLEEIAGAGKA